MRRANLLAVHMFEIVADMEPQAVASRGIQHLVSHPLGAAGRV